MNSVTFAPLARSTKLCDMAILGIEPLTARRTLICSPGLAAMFVTLNFMSSVPMISTVRAPFPAAAAAAGFWVVPAAAGFAGAGGVFGAVACEYTGAAASKSETSKCWYISVPHERPGENVGPGNPVNAFGELLRPFQCLRDGRGGRGDIPIFYADAGAGWYPSEARRVECAAALDHRPA